MAEEREEGEGASGSGSAAARSSLPPRKRILAGLKHNGWASPESASSASSVRLCKKASELPNFCDCHGCGSRMSSRGKDKLQTLDSEWRVVLLCKKCFNGVKSSEICSYCFAEVSDNCVDCSDCERRVHRSCIVKYQGFAPWSYSVSGSGVFTCVDCWVPKSLANSNGFCKSRNHYREGKVGSETCSVGNSRVSGVRSCSKSLEDVVKDANLVVEKKIAAAARAREKALRKAVAARTAAERAKNALDLAAVVAREENGVMDRPVNTDSYVDDAKLAIQLHRAINSSPRISRNSCSMNSDYLVAMETRHCNGNLLFRESDPGNPSVCGNLEICTDNKLVENPDRTISEPSIRIGMSDHDSSIDKKDVEHKEVPDRRVCLQVEKFKETWEDKKMRKVGRCLEACDVGNYDDRVELAVKEEEGSCSNKLVLSSGDDNSMDSGSHSCKKQDELGQKFSSSNNRTSCRVPSDGDCRALQRKRCSDEPDRYSRKYSKRHSSLKAISNCKATFLSEDCPLESQASASGIPLNCSKASRTFSDASFQSHSVPLQASACAIGPSRHQS